MTWVGGGGACKATPFCTSLDVVVGRSTSTLRDFTGTANMGNLVVSEQNTIAHSFNLCIRSYTLFSNHK